MIRYACSFSRPRRTQPGGVMLRNKLEVTVRSGRVVRFEMHTGGEDSPVIFTLSETSPEKYYGSCDADGGGERSIREAALDDALDVMNSHPEIQRPWQELMQLKEVTEARIRMIEGFRDVNLTIKSNPTG